MLAFVAPITAALLVVLSGFGRSVDCADLGALAHTVDAAYMALNKDDYERTLRRAAAAALQAQYPNHQEFLQIASTESGSYYLSKSVESSVQIMKIAEDTAITARVSKRPFKDVCESDPQGDILEIPAIPPHPQH